MTRTSFDAVDIVYAKLTEPAFKSLLLLTGGCYKTVRPVDSKAEDIVVNSLGLPNKDVQQGVVNVNIHAPNLNLQISGKQDTTQPDTVRLQALTSLVTGQIKEFYSSDYWFLLQQVSGLLEDEQGYYINIRIDFFSVNL